MHPEREEESPASLDVFSTFRQTLEKDEDLHYAGSPIQISAAPIAGAASASVTREEHDDAEDDDFSFMVMDPEGSPRITADEIFSNGQIRCIYPVFDRALVLDSCREHRTLRRLLIKERETTAMENSSSSSQVDALEGIPEGTYCVWNPRLSARASERRGKSRSTGSSLRWRIRDLVVRRSQSDGSDRFVFFTEEAEKEKGKGKDEAEREADTDRRSFQGQKRRGEVSQAAAGGRKSFLPYRVDILGFISNVNADGRIHRPC